jgi:hypothetical protein
MPKAPVDEDGHPKAWKNDIRADTHSIDLDEMVLAKAESARVQAPSNKQLGTSIDFAVPPHSRRYRRTARLRIGRVPTTHFQSTTAALRT